jgi:Fibronectin type III domain
MRRIFIPLTIAALVGTTAGAAVPVRQVRVREVAVSGKLPTDLTSPAGRSRWHLEGLTLGATDVVSVVPEEGAMVLETSLDGSKPGSGARAVFTGADRERWLLPDHDPVQMKMGSRVVLELGESRGGLVDDLQVEIEIVGIGWVHLASGPREAVLQRDLVLRRRAGTRAYVPESVIDRWVDPRAGVIAQVSGPASSDGRTRLAVDQASVLEDVITGAADLKIYADQLVRGSFVDNLYGWDRGPGVSPAALVPNPGISNVCDLVNLSSWDFSQNTTGVDTSSTDTPVNSSETCNATTGTPASCGYNIAGSLLGRQDRNLAGPVRKDNQILERENRAADVTIWLRAGSQNEGKTGAFGTGESDFCFHSEGSTTRTEVPLWRFGHNDAAGYYLQAGDSWASGVLNCEPDFFTTACKVPQVGTPSPVYGYACTNGGQTYKGQQSVQMIKGGVVTLPSGHTLNSIVTRNTADYCINIGSNCGPLLFSAGVRTIVYYWEVPYLGSVVLLRGPQKVDFTSAEIAASAQTPCTNFTSLDFTDIGYGLFPPVSISTGAVTDTSVVVSWNPGNDTHRINGYKVYWDTDSGASSNYAFDSVANSGQVTFNGTSATISGLTPGTPYFFTVTTLSDYTDPSSAVVTRYESIRYPTTASGDPNFAYPVEVMATTTGGTCIPTQEVTGLTVDKLGPPNVHVCWNATSDPCAVGYDVLGSADMTNDASWSVIGQVGLTTCWDGDPPYILVRVRGTGGTGPWGHYGH